jgi:hypothetical protein
MFSENALWSDAQIIETALPTALPIKGDGTNILNTGDSVNKSEKGDGTNIISRSEYGG